MTNSIPARVPRRRWWKVILALIVPVLMVIAGLPWLISAGPGRSRVAAGINRALSPGRLEFQTLHLSWFGPTRVDSFVLYDPQGRPVASSPSARIDRNLAQWIFGAPGPVKLTIDDARIEVERREDGSIDLVNALRSLMAHPDPKRDLIVKIEGGTLRYRDPFLAEPSTADAIDLDLRIRPAPDAVSWKLKLARDASRLEVQGEFDHWLAKGGPPRSPELEVAIQGKNWPFVARTAGVDAEGRLDGSLDFLRRQGQWRLSGDARILGLNARGAPLHGDTLAIERLEAGWDIAQGPEGWMIRRLGLTSPVGHLKAEGRVASPSGSGKQKIEGVIDLVALTRQLPHAFRLREGLAVDRGSARLTIDLEDAPGRTTYEARAELSDLSARDGDRSLTLRDSATFSARLIREGSESQLERFAIKTSFLGASARGKLIDGIAIEGNLDLSSLRRQLSDWVNLGPLEMAGRVDLTGNYRFWPMTEGAKAPDDASARFEQSLKATIHDLRLDGFATGPIRRDLATLELSTDGPAETAGWPTGWIHASARLSAGDLAARVGLTSGRDQPTLIEAEATLPLTQTRSDRSVTAFLAGSWSGGSRELALSSVGARVSTGPDSQGKPMVEILAQGKLNLGAGELILGPRPTDDPGAIGLDIDGIRVSGLGMGLEALRVEGGLTGRLDALDRALAEITGRSPIGLNGRWTAAATARGDSEGVQIAAKLGTLENPGTTGRPTSIAARANYPTGADRLDFSEFTVSTAYGTIGATGRIEGLSGSRRIDLKGVVAPDFAAINAELVRRVEPKANLTGQPRSFQVSGSLDGTLSGLDAELGFDLGGADIYGMKFGPSPVVVRVKAGKVAFDPISTSINEGHIRLEPEIDLDAPGGPVLRLAKNSAVREARINDEVSKRVLAYVAPILDQATRARGLVSVDLDHAEFPLGAGRGRETKVEGAVVFEDVEFAPGPLADDLLSAIGRRDASLKLDRPVTLTIADGRINQRGMSVPIGGLTRIEMAGWVDFDRNLAITATLPVTPAMLGDNPLLTDIVAGTMVRLPITGTLDHPVIDRQAMADNLKEMARSLIARGATRGALELLMRLGKPRDPNTPRPPTLTPEERKAQRQEKKAIRRGEVPPPSGVVPGL